MSTGNQKTNVVDYPLPSVSGALYANVAGDGSVSYEWRKPASTPETCSIATTPGATTADAVTVHISTTATAAAIYYTLDGSTPTTSSLEYAAAFTVSESCTVSAIASYTVGGMEMTTSIATAKVVVQIPALAFNYNTAIATVPLARTVDGGATWATVPVPPIASYLDGSHNTTYGRVSHGSGLLQIAVNNDSLFFTSKDVGATWNQFNGRLYYTYPGTSSKMTSDCFAVEDHDVLGGVAIVVGDRASMPIGNTLCPAIVVMYSYDGVNYAVASMVNLPTTNTIYCYGYRSPNYPQPRAIAYKDGVWIIALNSGYLRSTDPSVWTYHDYPVVISAQYLDTVATPWGFVIQMNQYIFYSTDAGVTFTARSISGAYTSHIVTLKHLGITIVMTDTQNSYLSTTDGVTWTVGRTLVAYVDYLYDCASTPDKDVVLYAYFSSVSAGNKLSPVEVYDKSSGNKLASFIRFTYPTQDYNTQGAASILWTGDNLLVESPLSNTVCRSTDGLYWTESTPNITVGTIMLSEDHKSSLAVSGTPSPVPTPTSSVPSGSYNCTTAGSAGTYTVTIGILGYNIIYTIDGTDPNLTQQQLLAVGNTAFVSSGGAQISITAGQTKRIRAIASGFDGRRSSTALDITITAVQI